MAILSILQAYSINEYILLFGIAGVFIGAIMLNWVNKTIGLKYCWQLFQMKRKKNKNKILLKVFLPNGKPQYIIKDVSNMIEYSYKENGKDKEALVKYDYYSMYRDFNDIPVLECDPNDIVPRNPFLNTSLSISGKLIKKNIVDSNKEDFGRIEDFKKFAKIGLPIIIAIGIIIVLYSSNQSEALNLCNAQLIQMSQELGKSAIINAG